ncbi:MAG: tetratricopeptide repeat-containing sensor histidine kinase [Bacteroidia bacterium]|nr:tetratricopeptide repeat-containing sensor histidine kinase [Bacteroidia bacterium]
MLKGILSFILIITLYPFSHGLHGELRHEDSLSVSLQNLNDSSRISELLRLCWEHRNASPEISIKYGNEAINLAEENNDFISLAKAYSFVGVAYRIMGKYSQSVDYYYKGLEVSVKHDIPEQAGYSYLNLANLYVYQGLSTLASENLKKAETIARELGCKPMLAYVAMYDGRICSINGKPDSALICYQKSLSLRKELNQIAEQATCYKYIGDIYFQKNNFLTAIENYDLSLDKVDKENDKDLYANLLIKKAMVFVNQNKLKEASALAREALKTASEIGANMAIKDALQVLVNLSLLNRDYKTVSDLQQKVIQYNDTLFSKQVSEKIFLLEYQLERQQRNTKIDLLNKDNSIKELKLKRIKIISIGLTAIIALLVAVFFILLILLKQRRKHEELLELNNQQIVKQRDSIEMQNRQLTDANERLEKSEEELKRTVQTKDKLLSIIAHDLRNPFTALIGLTELLNENSEKIGKEELNQYVSMINDSSHKLLLLIENLLAWARSQTSTLKPVRTNLNLKSQADDVMKLYFSQAETKGISLVNDIPENISVYADHEMLAIIIRNLISNGIKYTGKGGSVVCSAFPENGNIVLKVQDTGIGMSRESLNKLFKIGETFTTAGTDNESGTGLGLVICKEFTETLGGTITVDSSVGKGTTFVVTFPDFEK